MPCSWIISVPQWSQDHATVLPIHVTFHAGRLTTKQGEPADPKQKEARNPGKIDKHTLAGQNEASAPSRLRDNHDIFV